MKSGGLFWIKCESLENLHNDKFGILSSHNSTKSHKEVWERYKKVWKELRQYDFDHYPRGRVQLDSKKATIYLTPILDIEIVVEQIIKTFDLNGKIKIVRDGSEHYKCFLDSEEK